MRAAWAVLALLTSPAALAQQAAPPERPPAQGCEARGRAEAATPPQPGARDGTAPGNAGSTGWSGGTGGSHIGTNPQGATRDSPTEHPPTARGLDLRGQAEPNARPGC